jgi:hypothetical protein
VHDNLESQRRQYALVDLAQACGFHDVMTIDDDLGRSASGVVSRPGFEALVAQLCQGLVGAVFCLEASRLTSAVAAPAAAGIDGTSRSTA